MSERLNQCDNCHITTDEIRRYPTGIVDNMFICYECYKKYRGDEIEKRRPVYGWETLEVVCKRISTSPSQGRALLCMIAERLDGMDFTGNVLDDIWSEDVSLRCAEFLSEDESDILSDIEDEMETLHKAIDLVEKEFVRWLAKQHGMKIS